MTRRRAHRGEIRQVAPQQLLGDRIGRIIGEEMHTLDQLIHGHDKTISRRAIEQRRVVGEVERAKPRERREKSPNAPELAEPRRLHRRYSSSARSALARRLSTPFASPGSLPSKKAWAIAIYSASVTRGGMSGRCASS